MTEPAVLVVAPYLPIPASFGGAVRTLHLVRAMAQHQRVILLAPAKRTNLEEIDALSDVCDVTLVPATWTTRDEPRFEKRKLQLRSLASRRSFLELATQQLRLQEVVDRLFLTRNIQLVHYEFSQMALFQPTDPRPTVIDAHNVEHELLERVAVNSRSAVARILKAIEARKLKRFERRMWRRGNVVIATSQRDARRIQASGVEHTQVVPNGVECLSFTPPPGTIRSPFEIVFTGVLRHEPNAEGIHWYLDQVHPLVRQSHPDVTLTIIGADPPDWLTASAHPGVTVTGQVEDVRPYLWRASCAIVPIHSGGGTRLKILEAFAARCPVVSTTLGAEGIDASPGREVLLADEPQRFAAMIVNVMKDRSLATSMGDNALALVRSRYDWSIVADQLVAAHHRAHDVFRSRQHGEVSPHE